MSDLLEQAGKADLSRDQLSGSSDAVLTDSMWIRSLDPRIRIVAVGAFALTVVQL